MIVSSLCVVCVVVGLFFVCLLSLSFLSGVSGCVSFMFSHCVLFLHSLPKAPLFASSSAASFPASFYMFESNFPFFHHLS